MPAEFVGTWVDRLPAPYQDVWGYAFVIDSGGILGDECGVLHNMDDDCGGFPLVLADNGPGAVVLELRDSHVVEGCGSWFGTGTRLMLALNGDGTLHASTPDGPREQDGWSETLYPFSGKLDG